MIGVNSKKVRMNKNKKKKKTTKEKMFKMEGTKDGKIGWQRCMIISRQLKTLKKMVRYRDAFVVKYPRPFSRFDVASNF